MSLQDYEKAQKMGKKEYQSRLAKGKRPTLKVLDEILPSKGSYGEVSLGLVQIPIDQIVHTANGPQHTVKLLAGHAIAHKIDGLELDAPLLEPAFCLFRVEALVFAKNLNVQ